jgi:ABC-type branched-subunit amino acid transport system ATPase component
MTSPVVCEGLSKQFRRVIAVDDLHLEIPEGSIYALVGPNGAGKTTLIKMLVNLLKPNSGPSYGFEHRLAPAFPARVRQHRLRFGKSGAARLDDRPVSSGVSEAFLSNLGRRAGRRAHS